MRAIDFHTHAFPDFLAERVVRAITEAAVLQRPHTDGTVSGLLRSMDAAGIDASVVACIATAPEQSASILRWCGEIASDRIIPFPSVHPYAPDAAEGVRRIADAGFRGMKLHPLYQDIDVLDERCVAVYRAAADADLVLLLHSGDDLRFLGDHRCAPETMLEILRLAPGIRMVLAHLGGFWEATAFERHGLGSDAYIDLSHTIPSEPSAAFTHICRDHTPGHVMFGTDSPWQDQKAEVEKLRRVIDDREFLEDILWRNAARLLGMSET